MSSSSDIRDRTREWIAAGIIDDDQATRIVAHEASSDASSPGAGGGGVRDRMAGSLGVLGGLLVGLGVLLLVAANWSGIGDTAKVATIVLALVVTHGVGIWADARGAPRWMGTAAFTVATLVFTGGVFLLGQLFHVRAHDPLGFLVAAIAASAIAVLASRMVVGWIAGAAWLAWGTHEFVDLLFDEDDVLRVVGACLLLGIAAAAAGWVLDGIASRHAGSPGDADRPLAADLDVLGTPLRSISLVGLLGVLVPLSFAWHADEDLGDAGFGIATIAGAVVAWLATMLLARFSNLQHRGRLAVALASAIALVVVGSLAPHGVVIGLLANALLVGGGVGLSILGLVEDRRDIYSWGVMWIIVTIVARYIDVMVAFEFGGLGFIGVGLVLIACGWLVGRSRQLWRTREEL